MSYVYLTDNERPRLLGKGFTHAQGELAALVEDNVEVLLDLLRTEIFAAIRKHPPMNSAHEGYSVIWEELEELRAHVRADRGRLLAARKEAIRVAAMGIRYALDLTLVRCVSVHPQDCWCEKCRP